jgi:hypothetical protein
MNRIKNTRTGLCAGLLLFIAACSAQPGEEPITETQSDLVARAPKRSPYPEAIARGRYRGRDGSKGRGPRSGGCGSYKTVPLLPDATGWIAASSNPLRVQGPWFAYADGYGVDGLRDGLCQAAGHADAECSVLTSPTLGSGEFPNVAGKMCTSGTVTQTLDLNGAPDYGHMFGAGIGFILASNPPNPQKGTFDARTKHVIGFQFDIDTVPAAGLYVGFDTPASDAGNLGPDYWGANADFQSSPVVAGTNVVLLHDVQSPEANPQPIDPTQLEQMQFQVRSSVAQSSSFAYCRRWRHSKWG